MPALKAGLAPGTLPGKAGTKPEGLNTLDAISGPVPVRAESRTWAAASPNGGGPSVCGFLIAITGDEDLFAGIPIAGEPGAGDLLPGFDLS